MPWQSLRADDGALPRRTLVPSFGTFSTSLCVLGFSRSEPSFDQRTHVNIWQCAGCCMDLRGQYCRSVDSGLGRARHAFWRQTFRWFVVCALPSPGSRSLCNAPVSTTSITSLRMFRETTALSIVPSCPQLGDLKTVQLGDEVVTPITRGSCTPPHILQVLYAFSFDNRPLMPVPPRNL